MKDRIITGSTKNVMLIIFFVFFCIIFSNTVFADIILEKNALVKSQKPLSKISTKIDAAVQRVLVKYRQPTNQLKISQLAKTLGLKTLKTYHTLKNIQLLEVPNNKDVAKIITQLKNDPNILYAEPDRRVYFRANPPNDTSFVELWGLTNIGQLDGTIDADINATEAWHITTGDPDVVLAVIDTGIDYTHIDLKDNVWINPNEIPGNDIDDDNNGYVDDIYGIDSGDQDVDPMDSYGHGTHVSGIISARGNNGLGVTGVNWNSSILACKIDGVAGGFISAAVECLNYILELKTIHNINIVASNNSWGFSGGESLILKDAIQSNSDAGILFVAAAGNSQSDNDSLLDYPSSYYLPNIISVAATDRMDQLAFFTSYGPHTVHVSAPGYEILSTVPGPDSALIIEQNPHTDIFFDDMETSNIVWTAQSPWVKSNENSRSPTTAWADSSLSNTDYVNNLNSTLTSPSIDLTAYVATKSYVSFFAMYDLELYFDKLHVEMSGDNGITWVSNVMFSGFSNNWEYFEYLIPEKLKTANFMFRFRLNTDATNTAQGVFLDDIGVGTGISAYASARVEVKSGTSMSAPYVVGLLGLLKAQDPTRTWVQLKNLILAGGSPLPELAETTISGRRLRAWDNNGTGSLSCNNQVIKSQLRPIATSVSLERGVNSTFDMAYLHINCDKPAGPLTATILETNTIINLLDDGLGFDQVAGDGVYSAQINTSDIAPDKTQISLPNGSVVDIRKRANYVSDDTIVYSWRDISAAHFPIPIINEDGSSAFMSPFPLHFSDDPEVYNVIYVNDNGFLSIINMDEKLQISPYVFINNALPDRSMTRLIAPLWMDLSPTSTGKNYWSVIGEKPNRELVIEWLEIRTYFVEDPVTFQVVLFENNSNVLFNYKDVIVGDKSFDNGNNATVGIQVAPTIGNNYSFNEALLSNESSIMWRAAANKGGGGNNSGNKGGNNSGGGGLISLFMLFGLIVFSGVRGQALTNKPIVVAL